jgi:LmbE family N-acetylglucosaminyl deacetylase
MIRLTLEKAPKEPLQILCLGCHADDIEIGCGGTILKLGEEYPDSLFHWIVFSATSVRAAEAQRAAADFVEPQRLKGPILKKFRDGFLPYVGAEVKEAFEELKRSVSPHVIFTHNCRDGHQDHRLIAELTWNTFRDHFILEYEIPKYDGDIGQPGVFVPLSTKTCETKIDLILKNFRSQNDKRWFERETFLSLMRLRGMECNAPSGYAEAFYARKLVL